MKTNMGGLDRIIRLAAVGIIGFLYYNGTISGTLAIVGFVISVIFLLTSLVSFCPLYAILGINTCPVKK
jgi:Protein of unknown function (DUF2892)